MIVDPCCKACESTDILIHIKFVYNPKNEFMSKIIYTECLKCKTQIDIRDRPLREKLNKMSFHCDE